tara:strand:+ start:2261 stop:2569 length:309 start_codon:yes stop_codon:yes gene_type:complete
MKRLRIKPYLPGNEMFEEETWAVCEASINELYDNQEIREDWIRQEHDMLKRGLRKRIRRGEIDMKKLERLAELNVKKNYLDSKDEMIRQAYGKAIRRKYGGT